MPAPRAPEFFSPLPLVAVSVLALNDHVLKATFHNTLTGKLSDFAGCFFLPLFVSALLSYVPALVNELKLRVAIGCAATLALFVPIKLSAAAGDLVCATLEHVSIPLGIGRLHNVADPTDLLAVPMVVLAAAWAWKVAASSAVQKPAQNRFLYGAGTPGATPTLDVACDACPTTGSCTADCSATFTPSAP